MNQINFIGRVGGETELRHTPAGKAVLELNLAVDDGWGENKKTIWLATTFWGQTAELAANTLAKGHRVGISGRLSVDEWTDKTSGEKRTKIKAVCESMTLIEKREGASQGQQQQQQRSERTAAPAAMPEADFGEEDEIPF